MQLTGNKPLREDCRDNKLAVAVNAVGGLIVDKLNDPNVKGPEERALDKIRGWRLPYHY